MRGMGERGWGLYRRGVGRLSLCLEGDYWVWKRIWMGI